MPLLPRQLQELEFPNDTTATSFKKEKRCPYALEDNVNDGAGKPRHFSSSPAFFFPLSPCSCTPWWQGFCPAELCPSEEGLLKDYVSPAGISTQKPSTLLPVISVAFLSLPRYPLFVLLFMESVWKWYRDHNYKIQAWILA